MSDYKEQKNNTVKLFINKYKTADKHPSLKGTAVVNGKKYDASAWKNEDRNGNPWFNISLEEPYKKDEDDVFESVSTDIPTFDDGIPS